MRLFDYIRKYNVPVRNSILRYYSIQINGDLTVERCLQTDPADLLKEFGVGLASVYTFTKLLAKEYSLPEKWQEILKTAEMQNIKPVKKSGITDRIRKGAFVYVCRISNGFMLDKIKVIEVNNRAENPGERYVVLDKSIEINGKPSFRITGSDFEKYQELSDGFGIFRNQTEIRSVFGQWIEKKG